MLLQRVELLAFEGDGVRRRPSLRQERLCVRQLLLGRLDVCLADAQTELELVALASGDHVVAIQCRRAVVVRSRICTDGARANGAGPRAADAGFGRRNRRVATFRRVRDIEPGLHDLRVQRRDCRIQPDVARVELRRLEFREQLAPDDCRALVDEQALDASLNILRCERHLASFDPPARRDGLRRWRREKARAHPQRNRGDGRQGNDADDERRPPPALRYRRRSRDRGQWSDNRDRVGLGDRWHARLLSSSESSDVSCQRKRDAGA